MMRGDHLGERRQAIRLCLAGVICFGLAVGGAVIANAEDAPTVHESASFGGPDTNTKRIEADRQESGALIEIEALKPWYEFKDGLQADYGISFGLEYNAVVLTTNDAVAGADSVSSGGIFRFRGTWEAFGRGTDHPGSLQFLFEHTHGFTGTLPSSFASASIGSAGISNIPYNDEGLRLNTLYWDQKFAGGKYELIVGYLDISDYVDIYPLTSPWADFFGYSFSIGAGALDLANDGALGFAGGAWLTDSIYVIAGLVDQNSDATDPLKGFDTFFSDREYFKHFEIGWTGASQEAYLLNNLHLTLWHADEREAIGVEDGWGGVLSFNHAIDDKWLGFARLGWTEDGGSLLERSVSIGLGYTPSGLDLLFTGSQFGIAANWGRPNSALFGDLDDQYGAEAYYRLQVTPELAITPSAQLVINPALDPDTSTAWIFGLRSRIAF